MSRKRRCLIVDWVDSASSHGWRSKDRKHHGLIECRTVGFVVDEDDEQISLAQGYVTEGNDGDISEVWSIPKSCIKKKKLVR